VAFDVVRLEPRYLDALAELFRACECPCFCRYWHFEGDKNAWLARCAESPQVNEAELRADVVRGEARSRGLLAFGAENRGVEQSDSSFGGLGAQPPSETDVAGYMKLAPRASLPKLRARPVYRALDLGSDDGVLSIGCMLVRPDMRGRGVARALVVHAIEMARAEHIRAIEAYPHALPNLGSHEIWMGPHDMLVSLGFVRVAGDDAYPVLRFTLQP